MVFEELLGFLRSMTGKLVLAAIVLLVGVIIGRVVERALRFGLKHLGVNRIMGRMGLAFAFEETIAGVAKYAIYVVAFYLALNTLAVADYAFAAFAGMVIVVIVVALMLGLKDFVPNYWAGLWLYRKRFYKVGDTIEVNGIIGTVERFEVLETGIRTRSGDMIFLPSSLILHSQILKKEKHHA